MKNRYKYFKVMQQNEGQGFKDVAHYEVDSLFRLNRENEDLLNRDIKKYKLLKHPTRIIKRRELKKLKPKP